LKNLQIVPVKRSCCRRGIRCPHLFTPLLFFSAARLSMRLQYLSLPQRNRTIPAGGKAADPGGRLHFSRNFCKTTWQIYKFGLFCPGRMMYNHGRMNSGGNEEETDTLPALVEAGKVYAERFENGFDMFY